MGFTFNGTTPEKITWNGEAIQTLTWNGEVVWRAKNMTAETTYINSGTNYANLSIPSYGYVAVRVRANGAVVQCSGAQITIQSNKAVLSLVGESSGMEKNTGGLPYTAIFWYNPTRNYVKVGNVNGTAYGGWTNMGAPSTTRLVIQNHGGADLYTCYCDEEFGDSEIIDAPAWARPEYTP